MKIKCSDNLRRLAEIFEPYGSLYIVGGYVRNALLSTCDTDCDIASSLSVEKVFLLLENTNFVVKLKSAKMGTVEIFCGQEVYEHTSFRKESYEAGGAHSPNVVTFNASIYDDAKRRDFSVNSLYYKIIGGGLIDIYGGVQDIITKQIRCGENPEFVFCADGLRLLRMIRIASELGFDIEKGTCEGALKYGSNLKAISGERKYRELNLMLNANRKYKRLSPSDANLKALELLSNMDFLRYVVRIKGYKLKPQKSDYTLSSLCNDKELKMLTFFIDIYNYLNNQTPISVKQFVTTVLCDSLKCSNKEQKQTLQIISGYISYEKETNLAFYCARNINNIELLVKLFSLNNLEAVNAIKGQLERFKQSKTPLRVQELNITVKDIKQSFPNVLDSKLSSLLNKLLCDCILNPKCNTKEKLLEQTTKYI